MNIIRNIIITFVFYGLLSSCSQEAENKKISFKNNFIGCQFKMSQMYEEKYDSFCVIPPYFNGDSIPNHIIINDKLKKYCGNTLSSRDDAYIIFLIVANHVKSYSVIGRDDVLFFKLPHYKGISMEKELYMDRNRFVYE